MSAIMLKLNEDCLYKNAVIDIHKTAAIEVNEDFYVNSNRFKGSHAESYLKLQKILD